MALVLHSYHTAVSYPFLESAVSLSIQSQELRTQDLLFVQYEYELREREYYIQYVQKYTINLKGRFGCHRRHPTNGIEFI